MNKVGYKVAYTFLLILGDIGMYCYQKFDWLWGYSLYEWCWEEINLRFPE